MSVIDMKTRSKIDCQGELASQAEIARSEVISRFINKMSDVNTFAVASVVGGKYVAKCLREMADAIESVKGELE